MNFIKSIKVYDTEFTKVRIGDEKDGGYVVLDEISKNTEVIYSYGVENNISFEENFCEKYGTYGHLFDHTVRDLPNQSENCVFHREGIGPKKTETCDTLRNHLRIYGNPEHKTLKMDVEWCEWDVFDKMPDYVLSDFDQILCEFHVIPVKYKDSHSPYFTGFHECVYYGVNQKLLKKYKKVLKRLQDHYYIFHVHCNNSIPCNDFNGETIPPLIELSLVNKKLVKEPEISTSHFPIDGLDFPNKTDRPDITDIVWNP